MWGKVIQGHQLICLSSQVPTSIAAHCLVFGDPGFLIDNNK